MLTVPFLDRLEGKGADRPDLCLDALQDVARDLSLANNDTQ